MKKIYSKFVKDRRKEFQIETAVWDDNGIKKISKRKLYAEGQKHIDSIMETYDMYAGSGILCGLEEKDNKIFFEYIKGETFEKQLIGALKNEDIVYAQKLANQYNSIVDQICSWDKKYKRETIDKAENIFGKMECPKEGYANIIFDLTFDNIIFDEKQYKVIDYEWRFDFPLEKEFVRFRAVYAFVMKCKGLIENLYSIEDFYALFDVSLKNLEQYLEYNDNFVKYVYGENGYNHVIKKYEKKSIDVFNEESVNALKVLHNRKNTNEDSYEDMFFNKLLNSIEHNKEYYDDYTKFYKITKKIQAVTPYGYTHSGEFFEEFSAYIDDLYGMVKYYKEDVGNYYKQELDCVNAKNYEAEVRIQERDKKIIQSEKTINELEVRIQERDKKIIQSEKTINELKGNLEYMTAEITALRNALESTMEWKLKHKLSAIKEKISK